MVSGSLALVITGITLAVFVVIGIRASRRSDDVEDYVVARNSQPASTLALSFLAAGMGAWILFAPPEVGAGIGALGVAGYAIGAAAPIAAFGILGPRIRAIVPTGHSLAEFVRVRFGRPFQVYVTVISLLYMLFFVTAELTAVGGLVAILTGGSGRVAVIAVAVATLAYTVYGGLRASLRTDRFQAWLILALLAAAAWAAVGMGTDSSGTAAAAVAPRPPGLPVAITLIIAVTAANLFHQGYWQRVWAASDDAALRRGAGVGALLTVPVVALLGGLGILAAGRGLDLGSPPIPFFALLAGLPAVVALAVLVLGVALVASSVDTLETGLASLITVERPATSLGTARMLTVLMMVPAVVVALQGFSVLQLFLIADLLCAATAVPALVSLWRRATTAGALSGAVAGLAGALLGGVISEGGLAGARLVLMPGAVPTLPPFAGAVVASAVVTVVVSLAGRTEVDLSTAGRKVPALSASK
jgi:solute:Na+ symporter, SSS family